jgi:hypothetical protein
MPRYKLRTLLMLLAVLPPLLWFGWTKYSAWKAEQERQRVMVAVQEQATSFFFGANTSDLDLPLMPTVDSPNVPPRETEPRPPSDLPPVAVPEEPRE